MTAAEKGPIRHLETGLVHYRRISELKPDPKNARKHPDWQIHQIAESIRAFGFVNPVLVDKTGRPLAGHGRIAAAKKLGYSEVPTICISHLTEAQARAFAIADNRLTDNSKWDDKLLAENLKELAAMKLDFDIEVTGFSMGEIDLRIEGAQKDPAAADPADEVPPPAPVVSKLGDCFRLGPHRVLCGDATKAESYRVLMRGQKAAIAITDPPFNVPVKGHVGGKGRVKHREFVQASGEMTSDQFKGFLGDTFEQMVAVSKPGAIHFIAMDWRHQRELLLAALDIYDEQKNLCVWVKHSGGMGSLYRSQHELFGVFKVAGGKHRNNVELGKHGRNRTNVWNYAGVTPFGMATDEGNLLAIHPTAKPVRLVADALLDCSARGDIVLDPFLGSGTALIAAERVGRICYGMDLDPGYVDTAIRRWQAWTGEKAVHEVSGKTFDQMAKAVARGR